MSQYVGVPVRHFYDVPAVRPRDDRLDDRDDCRALYFTDAALIWGSDYSAYRTQYWTDPADPEGVNVGQSVGTFPGTAAARDRYNAVYNPNLFDTCNHAQLRVPGMPPGFTFELYDFKLNDDVMLWTLAAKYYGQYNGFNRVIVVWHLANVMAISSVAQNGNPAQAVKRLTDHILDRVG